MHHLMLYTKLLFNIVLSVVYKVIVRTRSCISVVVFVIVYLTVL